MNGNELLQDGTAQAVLVQFSACGLQHTCYLIIIATQQTTAAVKTIVVFSI